MTPRTNLHHLAIYVLLMPALLMIVLTDTGHAGGPAYVAGSGYFDPAVKGSPLRWSQGGVLYYTDQGNLSPLLPNASADAFVADAFSRWTSISTAALTATRGGQLVEDVSGSNVIVNPDDTITMPADIQPTALSNGVGIVYDSDGKVTDELLGAGSSDHLYFLTTAVLRGPYYISTVCCCVLALTRL